MHSMSLKLFVDFNDVKSRHTTPGQVSFGAGESPVRLSFGDQGRRSCRIIAHASERDGGAGAGAEAGGAESQSQQNKSSFFARSQTYALMKQQMELAAKSEVRFLFISTIDFAFMKFSVRLLLSVLDLVEE